MNGETDMGLFNCSLSKKKDSFTHDKALTLLISKLFYQFRVPHLIKAIKTFPLISTAAFYFDIFKKICYARKINKENCYAWAEFITGKRHGKHRQINKLFL